jgi:hypothetical protein
VCTLFFLLSRGWDNDKDLDLLANESELLLPGEHILFNSRERFDLVGVGERLCFRWFDLLCLCLISGDLDLLLVIGE